MIGNKVRANVDKLIGKVPNRLQNRFSGYFQNPSIIRGSEYAVKFALGWTFSAAKIFGDYAPFGLGFIAASGAGFGGLSAVLGALFGAVLSGGFTWATKYIAVAVLIFSAAFVFKDTKVFRKSWFMPLTAGIMAACTGFVYAADKSWSVSATAFYLMETILVSGSAYFYGLVLEPVRPEETDGTRRRVSLIIFIATVLISLSDLEIFSIVSVGRTAAVIAVMIAAFKGGMTWGSAAGIALGASMDAAAGTAPFFSAAFALSGLVSGVFSRNSRLVFLVTYVLANAISALWGYTNVFREALLYETFAASVIFMLLPSSLLMSWKEGFVKQDSFEGALKAKQYTKQKTERAARAFRDIYDILRTNAGSGKNDNDIAVVFDVAADSSCRRCKNTSICWQKEYVSTFNIMNDVSVQMLERGKLLEEDFPDYFRDKCVDIKGFTAAANQELKSLMQRRQYKNRLKENQNALYGQFMDMSSVLNGIAEELDSFSTWERETEKRLKLYLRGIDADVSGGVFCDKNGRLHIELEGSGIGDLKRHTDYLDKLSAATGKRLCADEERSGKSRLVLLEAEPLAASVGIASMRKRGENISGDSGTYFKTDEGMLCVILSDGMGSGDAAARDSAAAVKILERFLKAGVSAETALKILSSVMLLRGEQSIGCASVDLMCVNLFTGDTQMFKYGAAPSYVKKGKSVRRVLGESLAAGLGIHGTYAPDCTRVKLDSGSVAVIASDGVSCGQNDDWLCEIIENYSGEYSKELARDILESAVNRFGCEDDMTVLTINMETRE